MNFCTDFLTSNIFKDKISGIIGGVNMTKLKNILIPIPPIEEQKRIVEKLEQLLPYCKLTIE